VKSETARGGGIEARISYSRLGYGVYYVRLHVVRDGRAVYDARVLPYSSKWRGNQPLGAATQARSITLRDLDADGEPEILVDFFTGGAHCCIWTRIYRWDDARSTYTNLRHWFGDPGYRLVDLGGDGSFELLSADDRFAYAFASYAASGMPVQVWSYRGGRLVDVTRDHRRLLARDATQQWGYFRQSKRQHRELRGALAAWAADECTLGRGKAALAWLQAHGPELRKVDPLYGDAVAFVRSLARFLARAGYRC